MASSELHFRKASRPMRLRVLVSLSSYDFLNASPGDVHRLQPCPKEAAFWNDPIRVSWVIFSPFQANCPQGTAFLKGSDVEPRLRCQLVATLVWVSNPGQRMALLKSPASEVYAPRSSDCVEHITASEGSIFQA